MLDHPGKYIRDEIMKGMKKNSQAIAKDLDIPHHEVMRMVQEQRSIDDAFAEKLVASYPIMQMVKDNWMQLQIDYDAEQATLPAELPKYPGWHVVAKIMRGHYDDTTGNWMVKNSKEIADILGLSYEDMNTLISPKAATIEEPNPDRVSIDTPLANTLATNFPTVGLSSADWLQLQTDYDASFETIDRVYIGDSRNDAIFVYSNAASLTIGAIITVSGFLHNPDYNGTFEVTMAPLQGFETGVVFGSDESTGSFARHG